MAVKNVLTRQWINHD